MIEFFLGRATCYGWIPEWPKGTDCKSAANCFGGSNPPPSIRWCGGIGRRKGLKIPRWQHRAGSSPATSSSGKRSIERYFAFFVLRGLWGRKGTGKILSGLQRLYDCFLLGESRPEDVIHQAKQEKWLDTQMSLFDYIL